MEERKKPFDFVLISAILLLSLFGVLMVYSASLAVSVDLHEASSDHFFIRQIMALGISLVAFFVLAHFNYKVFNTTALLKLMFYGAIFALLLVFAFGKVSHNAESWFEIGSRSLQPAEFCKIIIIIYLSATYARKQAYINQLNLGVMPPIGFLVIVCGLVAIQPDLGTATIIFVIGVCIILAAGMNWKSLAKLFVIGLLFAALFGLVVYAFRDTILTEERVGRFTAYLHPFEHESDQGHQLIMSQIAISNGGLFGVGFGKSTQKMNYLPEPQTDMIISIIAEELGFAGVFLVFLLLGIIIIKGFTVAQRCNDPFGRMLAVGISSMLAFQAFVNLGAASGFLPITGVTLPLVSYGGSSLLTTFISVGILVNISMQTERRRVVKASK